MYEHNLTLIIISFSPTVFVNALHQLASGDVREHYTGNVARDFNDAIDASESLISTSRACLNTGVGSACLIACVCTMTRLDCAISINKKMRPGKLTL